MKKVTEIQSIECAFDFICPKKWDELEPTSKGISFCDTCGNNVYLCTTQDAVDRARDLGRCIAIEQVTKVVFMGMPAGAKSGLELTEIDDLLKEADALYASRKRNQP